MEKIIHKLINDFTEGVDTYTHNGSTWLIFTESKQWVIELTDSKTLWYNYNFFAGIFSYTSMDVVNNQSYITKWVEDNNSTSYPKMIDDVIDNGIKETKPIPGESPIYPNGIIDDVIESGEKINGTYAGGQRQSEKCKSVVEYGTKNPSV
jgi:hypothetical protein